ncbi:hypothetical protein [Caloramator sp. Dgby_cultured_2]|uniref:hypothetical protein n=1 Tax=Caloramator sp. Dgby_cultured_2 TaxID=3029174 RepID=UPI00237D4E04|nr:hypothetical protein [Caloramator sp. Dgby_cultured_2]WDU82899.1 hypothetical protein PWK10_15840 [Caloramator sp. Dgby_cultured_2]
MQRIKYIESQIIVISILVLVLAFLYSLYISKSITRPLDEFVFEIEKSKDNLVLDEINIDGYKEIKRLCEAFNNMNKRIIELDKKEDNL